MKGKWTILLAALLLAAGATFAHHSWGEYDMNHEVSSTGVISEIDWANPHVWINFDVTNDQGKIEKWSGGGPSPGRMEHFGWSETTLKVGDKITAMGNRLKDGGFKMRLSKVILPNGTQMQCYGSYGP